MDKPTNLFRYDTSGHWYKGNTHLHSIASDGGKDFGELAELYRSAGYDFLFRTDHWVMSDAEKDSDPYPLLWLDGVELDGKDHTGADYHVVCLGRINGIAPDEDFETALQSARQQGALAILAHPHWCGNSLDDAVRWHFDGVEVYNHVCHWLNGKGHGLVHWDAALNQDPNTLAFAADDGHLKPEHPGWNGGWIMVNAAECTRTAIFEAIRRGNFYASCGPEIHSITFDGEQIHIETSPIQFMRIVGPKWEGERIGSFNGQLASEFSIRLPREWRYVYVEVEDQARRRAWTNNLFNLTPYNHFKSATY